MKTYLIFLLTILTLQVSAQKKINFPLDFDKFVIEYDSVCKDFHEDCSALRGKLVITNDTITYNGVKYYVTHKEGTDGIKFFATSTRSTFHQIVVSGEYLIHGSVRMVFLVQNSISTFYFPIKGIDTGDRKFKKTYHK